MSFRLNSFIRVFLALLFLELLLSGCDPEGDAELARVAKAVNDQCPRMIDSETRIDGVEFRYPDTLRYNYSLMNLIAERLDTAQFRQLMWPGIVSHIKVSSELKKLRDNSTVIQYSYKDKVGKFACMFTVRPADYK